MQTAVKWRFMLEIRSFVWYNNVPVWKSIIID